MGREHMVSDENLKEQIQATEVFISDPTRKNFELVHMAFCYDFHKRRDETCSNRSCCSLAFILCYRESGNRIADDVGDNDVCPQCPFAEVRSICCPRTGINERTWDEERIWQEAKDFLPTLIRACIETLGMLKAIEEEDLGRGQ